MQLSNFEFIYLHAVRLNQHIYRHSFIH